MALTGELTSGKVFYDDLELHQLDRRTYLERLALAEARKRLPSKEAGWRAERLVRENFGAQTRPALLALPGESMAFQLSIPRGDPHLSVGLGSWRAAKAIAFGRMPSFVVRVWMPPFEQWEDRSGPTFGLRAGVRTVVTEQKRGFFARNEQKVEPYWPG